tara:strand:+ start:170 stop:757 length:588 start_codon:yes stop_codon:yes gene_type:complete
MKKIFFLLTTLILLAGCAETIALLGPASSVIGGGNVVHSSISSVTSYGVKKATGKSPMQHALAYAEEKNPNKKKDTCLSFEKEIKSEVCYIAKKQISSVKKSTSKKIKNIFNLSKPKEVEKIKAEQELLSQAKVKNETVKKAKSKIVTDKKIKTKQEPQLKSIESMLLESALNKKQISHLRVSIGKNLRIKNSSK